MTLRELWRNKYSAAFNRIKKNLQNIQGIVLGLNTNIDVIIQITPELIETFVNKWSINAQDLEEKILHWKGFIEKPEDYLVGLCGCFREGKASEWIITNEGVYRKLLEILPLKENYQIGGQTGIMANVLAAQNVPQIFVHTISFPLELKKLFLNCNNLKFPFINESGEVQFYNSFDAPVQKNNLFLHIISEFKRGDKIRISESKEWKCPRDNRFIATFDPLNSKMTISEAFKRGINIIAEESSGMIFSGFHMLEFESENDLINKLESIHLFLKKVKLINPELCLQLELSSTKKKMILEQLIKMVKTNNLWDSLSCNEREIAEVLDAIGRNDLASKIKNSMEPSAILNGSLFVFKELKLQRLHVHLFGYYILITNDTIPLSDEDLTDSLLYASIIAAYKAKFSDINNISEVEDKISTLLQDFEIANQFYDIEKNLSNDFQNTNRLTEAKRTRVIIIPTIIIENPIQTVGLGDTISASAFAAELGLKVAHLK